MLLLLPIFSSVCAQNYEFGKVSETELLEKSFPADSGAAAAILCKKGRTYFEYSEKSGFSAIHEIHFRIKIYKKEGLKWADFKVPYYVGYEELSNDRVKFSNAVTYNLDQGKIVKTKLNSEGTFKKEINEYWNEASITMPNVRPGSVMEFKYVFKSENIIEFPRFDFQYEIPVKFAEYKTEIPAFLIYKPILTGFEKIASESKIVTGYQNFTNKNNNSVNLSFEQINSLYTGQNIAALRDEIYVDNKKNYISSVQHELERTRYPDSPEKNYAMTWEGVAKSIYKEERFGKQLSERSYFEQDLKAAVGNAETPTEKTAAVLKYVKRHMNWDRQLGYLTKKGVRKAYVERTGNAAEINFILVSMLNECGVTADPVLVSTTDNGIAVFPNRTVFNYIIAAAFIDGKYVLLDATRKYTAPGILPTEALNWTGRLIRQNYSSEEIELMPDYTSKKNTVILTSLDADGTLKGKARIQRTDYSGYEFRNYRGDQSAEQYMERLESNFGSSLISDYQVENLSDLGKPVTETFNFSNENHAEIVAGKIYLNPMLFLVKQNPLVSEDRKLPLFFGYPEMEKYTINIDIPKGYAVESIPESLSLSLGDKSGSFSFRILGLENKVQIIVVKEINVALVSSSVYREWKDFFRRMSDKENEKIVLKKI